jgi:hypothetical protein
MTATPISVQGTFVNPNGYPAVGTVSFQLSAPISNGGTNVSDAVVSGVLDNSGRLLAQSYWPLEVAANDDAATTPAGTIYTITQRLSGQALVEFRAVVPSASTTTDATAAVVSGSNLVTLGSLLASKAMIGQAITGTGIPADTTVLDAYQGTQVVTVVDEDLPTGPVTIITPGPELVEMSAEAIGDVTGITVGGVVMFDVLQASAQ